eukprot:12897592-Alexandrium_andersonii.AAC.1
MPLRGAPLGIPVGANRYARGRLPRQRFPRVCHRALRFRAIWPRSRVPRAFGGAQPGFRGSPGLQLAAPTDPPPAHRPASH